MSWTYSGNPTSSPKDAVRFLIQDTIKEQPQLADEEIAYLLTTYPLPLNAAVAAVDALMAKYARMVDQSVGQVSVSWSQRLAAYKEIKATLRRRLLLEGATIYAGGVYVQDKQDGVDSSFVPPKFTRDMMEDHQVASWTSEAQTDDGDQGVGD